MGWGSGGELMGAVISVTRRHVPDKKIREELYKGFINAFEDFDCDTLCECCGDDPAFDEAIKAMHPDWEE